MEIFLHFCSCSCCWVFMIVRGLRLGHIGWGFSEDMPKTLVLEPSVVVSMSQMLDERFCSMLIIVLLNRVLQ